MLAEWLKIEPQALRFDEISVQSVGKKKKRWEDALAGPEREVILALAKAAS